MAENEAKRYARTNETSSTTVELIGPADSNINAAKAVYLNQDGSKQYVYYYYDRSWSRSTSKLAWFFWRVTADIPNGAPNDDAEFQNLIKTFRIDGITVDSTDKVNLEETRESFADFLAAQSTPIDELKFTIIREANRLLQGSADRSLFLKTFADIGTYTQKNSSDAEVNRLQSQLKEEFGKCWGQPQGQCSEK